MEYKELMEALRKSLGLEKFEPDVSGQYRLSIDDTIVTFVERTARGLVETVARICELPAEGGDLVCRTLLTAMAPGGAAEGYSFFIAPKGQGVYLRRTDELAKLDAEAFCALLEDFADALAQWRGAIRDFGETVPLLSEAHEKQIAEERHLAENPEGFLRV